MDEPNPYFIPDGGPYLTIDDFTRAMALQHAERIETALKDHFESHTAIEYLGTIQRLNAEYAIARSTQLGYHPPLTAAQVDNAGRALCELALSCHGPPFPNQSTWDSSPELRDIFRPQAIAALHAAGLTIAGGAAC
jgi:hypothetical protein